MTGNQLLCGCVIAKPGEGEKLGKGSGERKEDIGLRRYTALIDTGATGCAISGRVVKELNIACNQTGGIIGVHGMQESKIYRVSMGLFTTTAVLGKGSAGAVETQHSVNVMIANDISVSEFDNSHQNFDAIIGMEYLNFCTLVVSNGKFTLCY